MIIPVRTRTAIGSEPDHGWLGTRRCGSKASCWNPAAFGSDPRRESVLVRAGTTVATLHRMQFDTIERLNRDQVVTATDRLLLHRSRLAREIGRLRRDSTPTVVVRRVAKRSTKRSSMLAAVMAFACAVVTLALASELEATSRDAPYAVYQL